MEHPALLDRDTITTRLERACDTRGGVSTATVMSKSYLFGIFRGEPPSEPAIPGDAPAPEPEADDPNPQREADFHWRPPMSSYVPVSNHTPDAQTMQAFRDWIAQQPAELPQFGFLNLGDVDRGGHADEAAGLSFGAFRPLRQGAIEDTDAQLALLKEELESSGAWDDTVLIVLSDHSMDYGPQDQRIQVAQTLIGAGFDARNAAERGEANVVGGGGSGLVWVHDKADIPAMAQVLAAHEGADFISTRNGVPGVERQTTHAQIGFDHPRAPDIQVFAKPGYHVEDGGNPLPGNHAHSVTQPTVVLVAGGHPAVREGARSVGGDPAYSPGTQLYAPPTDGAGPTSVAPTVAALFGLGEPQGGYDVDPLIEALDAEQLPDAPVCGSPAAPDDGDDGGGGGGDTAPTLGAGGGPGEPERGTDRPTARNSGLLRTSINASRSRARPGARLVLSGRVGADPGCSGPYRVTVRRKPRRGSALAHHRGGGGVAANAVRVGADGRWRLRTRATRTAEYAAVVQPTRSCASGGVASAVVEVAARIRLFVPRSCRPGSVVSGRLRPSEPRTRILLQRRTRRGWATVARDRLDHHSAFGLRLPSCRGRYRVLWPRQGLVSLAASKAVRLP
jgi:hypothetical protein